MSFIIISADCLKNPLQGQHILLTPEGVSLYFCIAAANFFTSSTPYS